MKTRYARAQEENVQLRAELNEVTDERDVLRDTVMRLTSELEESITAMKLVNTQLILARSNPPVDDTRLREMALASNSIPNANAGYVARRRNFDGTTVTPPTPTGVASAMGATRASGSSETVRSGS